MDGTPWCRMTELNIYTVAYAQVLGPGLCKDDAGYRLAAVALYHLYPVPYSRAVLLYSSTGYRSCSTAYLL